MGKFADALEAGAPVETGRQQWRQPCQFGTWFEGLDDEDKAAIRNLFSTVKSPVTIAQRVSMAGYPISDVTVQRHRNGRCVQCHVLQTI